MDLPARSFDLARPGVAPPLPLAIIVLVSLRSQHWDTKQLFREAICFRVVRSAVRASGTLRPISRDAISPYSLTFGTYVYNVSGHC